MKKIISLGLCLMVVLSTMVPVFGQDIQVSPWAIGELNEGETYGLFPITWYQDGFLDQISQDRFERLLLNTSKKLENAGLEGNPSFEPIAVSDQLTRGEVVKGFYNLLGYYGLTEETDAANVLSNLEIVKGTGTSLALDMPCTVEQATVMAIRLIYKVYSTQSLGAQGLMWEVTNGENKVYLLGSIHLGSTDLYPLDSRILNAFNASDTLWVEANVLNQETGMAEFYEIAMLPEGETLEDQLDEALYDKLTLALETLGIPLEALSGFKPWLINNELSALLMQEGIDGAVDTTDEDAVASSTRGLDVYFLLNALLTGMQVEEVEGLAAQAMMFDNLSDDLVASNLDATLDMILEEDEATDSESEEMHNLLDTWFDYWHAGDLENFKESFVSSQNLEDEFTQMLFGARDVYMADRVHELLMSDQPGTHFIVVGAGHLVGDLSIIKNLEAMGYEISVY
jgi:uncharacterized protein YbaP (TraB family)